MTFIDDRNKFNLLYNFFILKALKSQLLPTNLDRFEGLKYTWNIKQLYKISTFNPVNQGQPIIIIIIFFLVRSQ